MPAVATYAPPSRAQLDNLRAAINSEHELAEQLAIDAMAHAIRCGELLARAKALIGHGAWLEWVRDNCHAGERTCRLYMQLAANRQRVADLGSIREAQRLLNSVSTRARPAKPTAAKPVRAEADSHRPALDRPARVDAPTSRPMFNGLDRFGNVIPPNAARHKETNDLLAAMRREIGKLVTLIEANWESPGLRGLDLPRLKAESRTLTDGIASAQFFCLCPKCKGHGCEIVKSPRDAVQARCCGSGWLTRRQAETNYTEEELHWGA